MLDLILIQDVNSGVNLVEYYKENSPLNTNHSSIFSGFLSAIQAMSKELEIGNIALISTEGENAHHCIITSVEPISIILIIDKNDSIQSWKDIGLRICNAFFKLYGKEFDPHEISEFKDFSFIIKEICDGYK
ncbi:MAG: hypothetical protein JXA99_12480 [Candidatus Lokiarchaeota archaeon]|nr:hypothetical protein [Candidatus Lokiarchaeota archaeon]